ncbi:MAG: hypothetical protein KJ970_18330 [Candidatus Eisenbacteria bacterium]|uniref:SecDF P1 head subdomain domain-containing protein n=1 Tax=Eiseniibacteriota bacterium TaxID=2212470 RepID=A0A948RZM4_UNCEI|nr:hypothetical protein [Candidatus Eisenbacteria bacterium]MBU1950303.1 hypothetical protein [Candidatus Eisenbacteria bacterium]MBU2692881.1 hypothetical protein [Candidatus Eisenbacteria bacterium]
MTLRSDPKSGRPGLLRILIIGGLCLCGCGPSHETAPAGWIRFTLEMGTSQESSAGENNHAENIAAILRIRLVEAGMTDAIVRAEGDRQIAVEAAVSEEVPQERIAGLLTRPARLEFHFVKPEKECREVIERLDRLLAEEGSVMEIPAGSDPEEARSRPLLSLIYDYPQWNHLGGFPVLRSKAPVLLKALEQAETNHFVPEDVECALSSTEYMVAQGLVGSLLHVLERTALISGDHIANAEVRFGLDPFDPEDPGVLVTLNPEGSEIFRIATRGHVESMLAIVMDGRVMSAPAIKEEIPNGMAQITGRFTLEEARDLSATLRSGALPAPLRIVNVQSIKEPPHLSGRGVSLEEFRGGSIGKRSLHG